MIDTHGTPTADFKDRTEQTKIKDTNTVHVNNTISLLASQQRSNTHGHFRDDLPSA